jgi:hypothetical protein
MDLFLGNSIFSGRLKRDSLAEFWVKNCEWSAVAEAMADAMRGPLSCSVAEALALSFAWLRQSKASDLKLWRIR